MDNRWNCSGFRQANSRDSATCLSGRYRGLLTEVQAEAHIEDLFDIQEKIASALVSRISPQRANVTRYWPSPKASNPGHDIATYYAGLMSAEALLDQGISSQLPAALEKFKTMVKNFPECARTQCGIAQCYLRLSQRGIPNSATMVSEARSAATKAVQLAPQMMGGVLCAGNRAGDGIEMG